MPRIIPNSPLINKLYADLQQEFPHLTIERTGASIRILPNAENGFVVELVDAIHEIVPVFGDWCNYGLGEEEAIQIFQAGVRGEARLHEISRAGVAYHWNVEFFREGVWVKEKHGYYEFPFFTWPFLFLWRKKERVLWNDSDRLR